MPYRLRRAPWWVLALVYAGCFAPFGAVIGLVDHHSWRSVVIGSAVGGAFFGIVMGLTTSYQRRTELMGKSAQEITAWEVVNGGPLPADPAVRELALGLGERRLADQGERQVFAVVVGALFAVGLGVAAVMSSPWYGVAALMYGVLTGWNWRGRRRLQERVRALRSCVPV